MMQVVPIFKQNPHGLSISLRRTPCRICVLMCLTSTSPLSKRTHSLALTIPFPLSFLKAGREVGDTACRQHEVGDEVTCWPERGCGQRQRSIELDVICSPAAVEHRQWSSTCAARRPRGSSVSAGMVWAPAAHEDGIGCCGCT